MKLLQTMVQWSQVFDMDFGKFVLKPEFTLPGFYRNCLVEVRAENAGLCFLYLLRGEPTETCTFKVIKLSDNRTELPETAMFMATFLCPKDQVFYALFELSGE